jgi:hypothetical protein
MNNNYDDNNSEEIDNKNKSLYVKYRIGWAKT